MKKMKHRLVAAHADLEFNGLGFIPKVNPEKWKCLDAISSDPIEELDGHTGGVTVILTRADGSFVTGSEDGTIKHWDLLTGQCLKTLKGHDGPITAMVVLKDGLLLSASMDYTMKRWNMETGVCVQTLKIENGLESNAVRSLLVLKNGEVLSGSRDRRIKRWNISSGKCVKWFHTGCDYLWNETITGFVELKDGSVISAAKLGGSRFGTSNSPSHEDTYSTLTRWNVETGERLDNFKKRRESINAIIKLNDAAILTTWGGVVYKWVTIPPFPIFPGGFFWSNDRYHGTEKGPLVRLPDDTFMCRFGGVIDRLGRGEGGKSLSRVFINAKHAMAMLADGTLLVANKDKVIKRFRVFPPQRPSIFSEALTEELSLINAFFVEVEGCHKLKDNKKELVEALRNLGVLQDVEGCYDALKKAWGNYTWDNSSDANYDVLSWLLDHAPIQMQLGLVYKVLDNVDDISLRLLELMFISVDDVLTLKLPYTLLCIAVREELVDSRQAKILLNQVLRHAAEHFNTSSKSVANFILLLKSARKKGLITDVQYQELKNIAQDCKTFSDPRFVQLKATVEQLSIVVALNTQKLVELDERVSRNAQNIQYVADSLSQFKKAVEARNARHFWLTIARSVLSLIPFGGFVEMGASLIERICDLSDVFEAGYLVKEVIVDLCERSMDVVVEIGAEKIINPEKYIEVWSEAKMLLESKTSEAGVRVKGELTFNRAVVGYKSTARYRFSDCARLRLSEGYKFYIEKRSSNKLCISITELKECQTQALTEAATQLAGEQLCALFKQELITKGFHEDEFLFTLKDRELIVEGDQKVIDAALAIINTVTSAEEEVVGCVFA